VDEKTLIAELARLSEREVLEDELEHLAAQSGVAVCGTWPDSTKPHGFHYEVLKGNEVLQKSQIGHYSVARVHCKTRGEVTITKNMFFGPPEQS
jgi:hypothetical protein